MLLKSTGTITVIRFADKLKINMNRHSHQPITTKKDTFGCLFSLAMSFLCEPTAHSANGSNLKAKRKRLSIVFATLYTAKQGVCRAEQAHAKADDYATGESWHLQKEMYLFSIWSKSIDF